MEASGDAGKTAPATKGSGMSFVDKLKKSFSRPSDLFIAAKSEQGIKGALIFHALFSLILLVLLYTVGFSLLAAFALIAPELGPLMAFGSFLGIVFIIGIWIVSIVGNFVGAGIYHIFVVLFGGKNGYSNTYKAVCYSIAPGALLGWIPVVNFMGGIYSIYLLVKGISILQDMTPRRALLTVLVPIIVAVVIVGVFVAAFFTLGVLNPASFTQNY
jgi:hypothetical protein